jgi:hypothetical protein
VNFSEFESKKEVRKASFDKGLFDSIVETVKIDLKYLGSVKIDKYSARKVLTNYYDVLRSLLEAMALKEGYKVYSHEAFVVFLKEKGEDNLSLKFDRYRKKRNKVNYYGAAVSIEESEDYSSDIQNMIEVILKKYF